LNSKGWSRILFCSFFRTADAFDDRSESGDDTNGCFEMLADLRQEREQIEEAIMTLERLARGRGRRRGRPPAWMTAIKRRGRPPGSKNKAKEAAAA